MARPRSKAQKRKDTEDALRQALELNNASDQYLQDQVDEYMNYYDNLGDLNECMKKEFTIGMSKEKRQITKEMRNILTFLGLKPVSGGGGGFEEL